MTDVTHTRSRRRWYIWAALVAVLVIGGFKVANVTKESERRQQTDQAIVDDFLSKTPDQIFADLAGTAANVRTKIEYGNTLKYSLEVPEDWAVERFDRGAVDMRVSLMTRGMIVDVLATPGNLGGPEQAVGSINQWKEKPTTPTEAFLSGKRWLRLSREITASSSNTSTSVRLRSVDYVYSGPEGTFAISGSSPPSVFSQNLPQLERVIRSFRFPPDSKNQ